jgi:hypothetical protein
MDLATGAITRGSAVRDRAGSTAADFTNLDLAGFIGVDTGGGACEWIDAAAKGFAGNASDLMTQVVFPYCTVAADTASGGPGATVVLGFYEGYATGGPAPTTAVALFNLTGLPGHTADSCLVVSGNASCYYLTLDLDECVAFADGPIGYSWLFADLDDCDVLAQTWPWLACVQSCSGMGPDGQGMVDQIDQYCPPGTLHDTFSNGTTPIGSYFTSIAMEIREVADAEAVATSWNGQSINEDMLHASAIAIGASWQVDITLAHAHGSSGPTSVKVRSTCVNGPNLTSPSGHPIEGLISGALVLALGDAHDGSTTSYSPFAVPCDLTLVGIPWAAQGTVLGGGRADLTSARCGVVGSIDALSDP